VLWGLRTDRFGVPAESEQSDVVGLVHEPIRASALHPSLPTTFWSVDSIVLLTGLYPALWDGVGMVGGWQKLRDVSPNRQGLHLIHTSVRSSTASRALASQSSVSRTPNLVIYTIRHSFDSF
jgi:hypothetical protein